MSSTILAACAVLAASGCAPDKGKTDVGMSARSSTEVPAALVAPSAPPAIDAVKDDRPVIACFGDSITAGYGLDTTQSYPAVMQRDLDAQGYAYRVVNFGVSGETTKDGLLRVQRVVRLRPAIAIVEFGGNDGLRGLPLADSQTNLDAIVRTLQSAGIRVVLAGISLPPQFGRDYITRFNAMFPAVARKRNVPLLPFLYKGVFGVPGSIQEDGVHPTAQGAIVVAKNIEGLIQPLLHK